MTIKSFSLQKRDSRRIPWELRQELAPYLVTGVKSVSTMQRRIARDERRRSHGYGRAMSTGSFSGTALASDLLSVDQFQHQFQSLAARMTAGFQAMQQALAQASLQVQNDIVQIQAQDEASIQALLPSAAEQAGRDWQIQQNGRLRAGFIDQCELLSSKQVADLLESKAKNRAATASHLKDKGKVFCVRLHGQDYFPAFQFDPVGRRCHVEMAQLLQVLARDYEPGWQLALWFIAANAWLAGRTPLQVWAEDRSVVVCAAMAESAAFDA